ncbi:hypothetical protein GN956_G4539 [Arapaima gigas]
MSRESAVAPRSKVQSGKSPFWLQTSWDESGHHYKGGVEEGQAASHQNGTGTHPQAAQPGPSAAAVSRHSSPEQERISTVIRPHGCS